MNPLSILMLIVCTLSLLGCGQSGPLYLPSDPQRPVDVELPIDQDLF